MAEQFDTAVVDREEAKRLTRKVRAKKEGNDLDDQKAQFAKQYKKPAAEPAETKLFLNYSGKGAPTLYRPEYADDLIEHMKNGGGLESFGSFLYKKYNGAIKGSKTAFSNWLRQFKDFSDAKEFGDQLSFGFWEEMGRAGAAGQLRRVKEEIFDPTTGKLVKRVYESTNLNGAVWMFIMKNKHKWTEKVEVSNTEATGDTRESKRAAFSRLMADEHAVPALERLSDIIDTNAIPTQP